MASSITITGNGSSVVVHRILNSQNLDQITEISCSSATSNTAETDKVMIIYNANIGIVTIYDRDATEAGTTLSVLQAAFTTAKGACSSGGGSGITNVTSSSLLITGSSTKNVELQIIELTVVEAKAIQSGATAKSGVLYAIIEPQGEQFAIYFGLGLSNGLINQKDGNLYKDITVGGAITDRMNQFTADYDIANDIVTSVKNYFVEIKSTCFSLLNQIGGTGNPINFRGYIHSGLTVTIDPAAVGMNAQIYSDMSLAAGASFNGRIEVGVPAVFFPAGTWNGTVDIYEGTVATTINVNGMTALPLKDLFIQTFIGIIFVENTSGSTVMLINRNFDKNRRIKIVCAKTNTDPITFETNVPFYYIFPQGIGSTLTLTKYPDQFTGINEPTIDNPSAPIPGTGTFFCETPVPITY